MQTTRSEITKNMLAEALEILLQEKTLGKITIKDIVAKCGLNRQTFYYHFDDIYELVEWVFRKKLLHIFTPYSGEALWQEGLKDFLIAIENNRQLCKNALCDMSQEQMYHLFFEDISALVNRAIYDISGDMNVDDAYSENIVLFFSISFASIIEQWTYGKIDSSTDALVCFLDIMIQDQINGAISRLKREN